MEIIKYPDEENFNAAVDVDDPLLVLVSHDGERIIASQIDDGFEHHILLKKAGFPETDIDKYFRLVVNKGGADWVFLFPENHELFKLGNRIIPPALKKLGYDVPIEIPKRYKNCISSF